MKQTETNRTFLKPGKVAICPQGFNNGSNMKKEEIIKYLKDNPSDLLDVCTALNLRFPYENRDELMEMYNFAKSTLDKMREDIERDGYEKWRQQYSNVKKYVETLEKTYHIFEPEFDEEMEKRWIPEQYDKSAREVFEYRKDVFNTQNIVDDKMLEDMISKDMGQVWSEKGGQDGMYDSFPFTWSNRSMEREYYEYDPWAKCTYHCKKEMLRSYALDSSGGVCIIESRLSGSCEKSKKIPRNIKKDWTQSRFQIVTLGEDDGYHFLRSANIYCHHYGDKKKFTDLLDQATKEFDRFTKQDS